LRKVKNISAFNYFGGKNDPRLQAWIKSKLDLIPVYHLAETFAGSAAITLNYQKAKIRTINDLNSDIYNFFRVLRDHGPELITALELTPHCRQEYDASFMDGIDDPIEKARVFFLRTNQSFGNSGGLAVYNSWSYTINDQRYRCSQSTARYLNKVEGLHRVVQELRHLQIENCDFREFIKRYDGPNTVFYVDPPYVAGSRSYNIKYRVELTTDDHVELSQLLKNIKGKWLLSGYPSELYAELYKGYSSCSMGAIRTAGKNATEVLWANYELNQNDLFHATAVS
jgi:DNA adenine methylase